MLAAALLVMTTCAALEEPGDTGVGTTEPAGQETTALGTIESAPGRLEGFDLYLAQVVAVLGAEALFAPLVCIPGVGSVVGSFSPALGALAVDWVGREMGHRQGSQVAAITGSYVLSCAGGALYGVGYFAALLPGYLGLMALGAGSQLAGPLFAMAIPGAGITLLGLGLVAARPLLVPLFWSWFGPELDPELQAQSAGTTSPSSTSGVSETADRPPRIGTPPLLSQTSPGVVY